MGLGVGIDPGLTNGAITVLSADHKVCLAYDVPTVTVKKRGKIRKSVCWAGLHRLSCTIRALDPDFVMVEMVGGVPGQSAPAAFNFGYASGLCAYSLFAAGIPIERFHFVAPATWTGALGLRAPGGLSSADKKEYHRGAALKMWPQHASKWPLRKHTGRAEAALIAEYGHYNVTS